MEIFTYFSLLLAGAVGISAKAVENAPLAPDGKVIDIPGVDAPKFAQFADFSDFVNRLKIPHTYDAVIEYLQKSPVELDAIVDQRNPGLTPSLGKADLTKQNGDEIKKGGASLNTPFRRTEPIEEHTISLELQLPKEDSPSPNSKSESYHFASNAVASSNSPGLLHIEWGSNKRLGENTPVVESGSKDYVLIPKVNELHVIFDKLYGNKDLPNILKSDNSGKPADNSAVQSSISNRFITEEFESPKNDDKNQLNIKGSHFSSQSSQSFSYQGGSIQS